MAAGRLFGFVWPPSGDVIDRISIGFSTCFCASDYLNFDVDTDAAF